jgi:murein DD-endopeptidase MepM/ murein hydrolase activator NlpD
LKNSSNSKPDEPAEILVRDELLTGELYIILLDKDQQPLRGGIIQKNTDDQSSNIEKDPDFALNTLCETLEYNQNPLTATDNAYEYNNPNWGMKYTISKENNIEPAQLCGGGTGFVGSRLQITTQFSPSFSEGEKQSADFLSIAVTFPVTENNNPDTTDKKKFMIGSDEGFIQEKIHRKNPSIENDTEQNIEKEFALIKNGFLYTVNYQSSLAQKDTYDTLFYSVLDSLKLSDPLWLSQKRDDTAFIKVFETGEIYDLKNNEWIKKSKPKYLDQEHDDEESSESVEPPLSNEEKIDIPLSMISPVSVFNITQYFHSNHNGVDFVTSNDTNKKSDNSPIFAVADGTVTHAECGWNGGYGCYITIDHGHDIETLYAHTQKNFVSVGQTVKQGDIIAVIGDTGRTTGPHLHFEVHINGIVVNPIDYLE